MNSFGVKVSIIYFLYLSGITECCSRSPPKPIPSPVTPTPTNNSFKYSKEFLSGNFTLFYNEASNGRIKAQITTVFECEIIGFFIFDLSIFNVTNGFIAYPQLSYISIVTGEGLDVSKPIQDKEKLRNIIDFDFVLCKSNRKINFGTNIQFSPGCSKEQNSNETVIPILEDIEKLESIINNTTC